MDRIDAMALFVAAVEEGSLAAAGRRHARSAAAVTRAVALLERIAGEPLLLRSTRKLSLTPAGERCFAIWQDVLARLRDTEADDAGGDLQGGLTVTAPELFGRQKVMPIVEQFLRENTRVSARVLMTNRLVDLLAEGVDLAVRLAPLPDSTMKAVKVGEVRTLVCASPGYLARAGRPATPSDLERHECIGLNVGGNAELWGFATGETPGRHVRSTRVRTRLAMSNAAASIDAACRGHGIIRPLSYQVADDIAAGRLIRLLPSFEPPSTPVHLFFHSDRARRGVVRAFIDLAVPALRRELVQIADRINGHGNASAQRVVP